MRLLILYLVVILVEAAAVNGFFSWIIGGDKAPQQTKDFVPTEVSFELASTDEKFLAEVKKLSLEDFNDSALGNCHSRLVLSLKQTCAGLSQEEIGKVAVNLLNCQNFIEKRRQFPCTPSMSLADCTRDMDAPSWTVYQLMSNRALAVCHSVAQHLFRARTELLINRLAEASVQHVGQLREMHEWHNKLRDLQAMADARMSSLSAQHDTMVYNQEALLKRQKQLERALQSNTKYLLEEKEQLEVNSHSLLSLTNEVKSRLDATVDEVKRQEELIHTQRNEMQNTIKKYENSIQAMLENLENRGEIVLAVQDETFARVQKSLESVQRVNDSLDTIGTRLQTIQEDVFGYIEWIQSNLLGRYELLWSCIVHGLLMLALMSLAAFLRFPILSRLVILIAVPANIYLTLTSEFHVSPVELLLAIVAICIVDAFIDGLRFSRLKRRSVARDELRQLIDIIKSMEQRIEDLSAKSPHSRTNSFNIPETGISPRDTSNNWPQVSLMEANSPEPDCASLAASDISELWQLLE
ncbi:protein brambleberry-like isoform X3 [Varroa destructor]|uniref:Uncharacterized protein n=1 Tax=Varroa destructor TaxID=109461 RepID=A0A7M7KHX9_VARDE|nr:protein brambleberry-like isoform X3 [Varroa destructor]